ncbi:MAG: hypothetical protein K0S05_2288 [Agromyces sp.]|jgi:hypothetical protein|nr:hypothetical protein [Agromyces sp.]
MWLYEQLLGRGIEIALLTAAARDDQPAPGRAPATAPTATAATATAATAALGTVR